jgi:hypothetical protein
MSIQPYQASLHSLILSLFPTPLNSHTKDELLKISLDIDALLSSINLDLLPKHIVSLSLNTTDIENLQI